MQMRSSKSSRNSVCATAKRPGWPSRRWRSSSASEWRRTRRRSTPRPSKIKKAAQQSESNLNRPEKRETIIEKLAEKGIKDSDFAKVVDEQVKTALVADNYKAAREWVTPEPGAGLIRDTPALIAVTELYAYPGRGGLLVYELDERRKPHSGHRQGQSRQRSRRRRVAGGRAGGMMGGMAE